MGYTNVREYGEGVDDGPGTDLVVLATELVIDASSNDLAILFQ